MSVYTVHEPPLRASETLPDPGRFVFVRDEFYFWAFLLTALWMLWHRMWLVLLIYIVVAVGLEYGLYYADVGTTVISLAELFIALLVGIEAGTLRRFTLAQRRFRNVGVVSGVDLEDAERRFFDAWVRSARDKGSGASAVALGPQQPSPPAGVAASPDIIGLFPEPGASR